MSGFLLVDDVLDVPVGVLARHQKEEQSKSGHGHSNSSTDGSTGDHSSLNILLVAVLGIRCGTAANTARIDNERAINVSKAVQADQCGVGGRTDVADVDSPSAVANAITAHTSAVVSSADSADVVLGRIGVENRAWRVKSVVSGAASACRSSKRGVGRSADTANIQQRRTRSDSSTISASEIVSTADSASIDDKWRTCTRRRRIAITTNTCIVSTANSTKIESGRRNTRNLTISVAVETGSVPERIASRFDSSANTADIKTVITVGIVGVGEAVEAGGGIAIANTANVELSDF